MTNNFVHDADVDWHIEQRSTPCLAKMAPSTTNSIDGLPPVSLRRVEVTASMEAATAPPPPSPPPRASPIGAASPSPAAIAAPESFPAAKQHKNQYEKPVEANFWDQQIAQGNLSMCSVKYPTYVNVMLYGESGLGKTVSTTDSGSCIGTCTTLYHMLSATAMKIISVQHRRDGCDTISSTTPLLGSCT